MSSRFVNLHVSSSHSILYGAASPREIVRWAERFKQDAIELTDKEFTHKLRRLVYGRHPAPELGFEGT